METTSLRSGAITTCIDGCYQGTLVAAQCHRQYERSGRVFQSGSCCSHSSQSDVALSQARLRPSCSCHCRLVSRPARSFKTGGAFSVILVLGSACAEKHSSAPSVEEFRPDAAPHRPSTLEQWYKCTKARTTVVRKAPAQLPRGRGNGARVLRPSAAGWSCPG